MLEIKPVYTSYEREEYTKVFNITPESDHFVICARNNGRFVGLGYGYFAETHGTIEIMKLVDGYDDDIDRFLLGKAVLNFLDINGVKTVIYTGDDIRLAKALGFSTKTKEVTLYLEGYFSAGHEHEKKEQ